ncbi:MAG: energy-coupling factor ABC transporter permease [Verrucomicrobiota bacterium]|jgi:cobalt/nickel transport system permease protein
MHIPDGFLDAKTATVSAVLAGSGVGVALSQVRRHLARRKVPLLGLAAAFVFAAQLLNFPVLGGTSGHLLGGVLAAVLLGPSAAVIALTCVLVVQCFLFSDGGVTALGANILNMAVINPVVGYGIYRLVRHWLTGTRGLIVAAAFASWCATVVTAIGCAGQLAFAGTMPWGLAFPAMANIHMLIGLGEGLITALVITAIARVRPELVAESLQPTIVRRAGEFTGLGVLVALGLALFIAPFACPWPDGLEKVAATLGVGSVVPGLKSAMATTAVAGAIGTLVAFGLSFLLARLLAPKQTNET